MTKAACGLVGAGWLMLIAQVAAGQPVQWRNLSPSHAHPPAPSPDTTISPQTGAPADEAPEPVPGSIAAAVDGSSDTRAVLFFARPLHPVERARLATEGVELLTYLSGNAWLARMDRHRDRFATLRSIVPLVGLGPFDNVRKLHRDLLAGRPPEWSVVEAGPDPLVALLLVFHADITADADQLAAIDAAGATLQNKLPSVNAAVVHARQSAVVDLARDDRVLWIEPPLPLLGELNAENRTLTGAGTAQNAPYGLSGQGVTVFVLDSGRVLDTHPDFASRLTSLDSTSFSYHATHVAGTVGGDGNLSSGTHRGMAPAVQILSAGLQAGSGFLYTNPGDVQSDHAAAIAQGAHLSNNSIGTNVESNGFNCEWQGDYGVTCAVIDGIVRGSASNGQPFRIFWAAGNERRTSARCDVEGFGQYMSLAPPSAAKNHISVGAVNANNDSMTTFSSWGPSDDGRLKPDLVAPGCQSTGDNGVTSPSFSSTDPNRTPANLSLCGTSMASPTAAGLAALLLEEWRLLFPGQPDPRNSALKAVFINTAIDRGNTGPDYQFGYGSIRILPAIDLIRDGGLVQASLTQGQVDSYAVVVPPGTPRLKITLAWDDPPGQALVIPSLVNDLDLVVTSPGGVQAGVWRLDPLNPSAPAVRDGSPDRINNVEQVELSNPQPGLWTVQVVGHSIVQGPQPYSLAGTPSPDLVGQISFAMVGDAPARVSASAPTALDVQIIAVAEDLVIGSPRVHFRFYPGSSFLSRPLQPMGSNIYRAVLPPCPCDGTLEYYFTAQGSESGLNQFPDPSIATSLQASSGSDAVLFEDDFEESNGWTLDPTDTATAGIWSRNVPQRTSINGQTVQPGSNFSPNGTSCLVTDHRAGSSAGTYDLDNGRTTARSPVINAAIEGTLTLSYYRWYTNSQGAGPNNDTFSVDVSNDGGQSWINVETVGPSGPQAAGGVWWFHSAVLNDIITPTANLQVRFVARDDDPQSLVEALVDEFRLTVSGCTRNLPCPSDLDADGLTTPDDLELALWSHGGNALGDLSGDGQTRAADLALLLSRLGQPCN